MLRKFCHGKIKMILQDKFDILLFDDFYGCMLPEMLAIDFKKI